MTPEEYTSGLFEGITYNVVLLTEIVYEAMYDPTNVNDANFGNTNVELRNWRPAYRRWSEDLDGEHYGHFLYGGDAAAGS